MSRHLLLTCNSRSATISIHEIELPDFALRHRGDVALPVPQGENSASPMALGLHGHMVYLAWRGAQKKLLSFTLGPDAATLTLVDDRPIDDDLCYLQVDPNGHRLLGAGGENLVSFALNEDGMPGRPEHRIPLGPLAHCFIGDGQGRAFATACRGDLLRSFTYDPKTGVAGALHDVVQPVGSGPRHLCVSPDNRHLYLVTQESGEVVVFAVDEVPRELQRLSMVDTAGPMGGDIGITLDGRFVYATERSTNSLVGFAVEPRTGLLERTERVEVPDYPRAFTIGGNGQFLVVLGFRGHKAEIFAIGCDGALTRVAEFATGERPSWVLAVDVP